MDGLEVSQPVILWIEGDACLLAINLLMFMSRNSGPSFGDVVVKAHGHWTITIWLFCFVFGPFSFQGRSYGIGIGDVGLA